MIQHIVSNEDFESAQIEEHMHLLQRSGVRHCNRFHTWLFPHNEIPYNSDLRVLFGDALQAEFGEPAGTETRSDKNRGSLLWELEDGELLVFRTHDDDGNVSVVNITGIAPYETGPSLMKRAIGVFEKLNFQQEAPEEADGQIYIQYALPDPQGRVNLIDRNFKAQTLNSIAENYTPGVITDMWDAIKRVSGLESGLLVLNGPPGTGKTHLLRAMLTELAGKKKGLVCTPPLDFLQNMSLMMQATSRSQSSLILMEDVGDILTEQAASQYPQVNANLLNMSDGLLSLLNNSVIVLTFNTAIDKINKAVLRPGRCISHLEVNCLPRAHVEGLLETWGATACDLTKSEYTLAEAYEIARTGKDIAGGTAKLGFGR